MPWRGDSRLRSPGVTTTRSGAAEGANRLPIVVFTATATALRVPRVGLSWSRSSWLSALGVIPALAAVSRSVSRWRSRASRMRLPTLTTDDAIIGRLYSATLELSSPTEDQPSFRRWLDWEDGQAVAILTNCRRAMAAGARVLLVERYLATDPHETLPALHADLEMLVNVGGRERTTQEYATLPARSGLRLAQTISLGRLEEALWHHLIEAQPLRGRPVLDA